MTRKEKNKAQELANFILNNITMAEIMSILAKRSTEIAEQIVQQKLPAEDYRTIIVSDDTSFKNKVKVSEESWWTKLLKKLRPSKGPLPPPPPSTQKKRVLTGRKRKGVGSPKKLKNG